MQAEVQPLQAQMILRASGHDSAPTYLQTLSLYSGCHNILHQVNPQNEQGTMKQSSQQPSRPYGRPEMTVLPS